MTAGGRVVVIGVGNDFRRDDGAGVVDDVASAVLSDLRDRDQGGPEVTG